MAGLVHQSAALFACHYVLPVLHRRSAALQQPNVRWLHSMTSTAQHALEQLKNLPSNAQQLLS